jgi:ABC-type multidrug transport system ATPase subunit
MNAEAEKLCDRLALITHGTVRMLDTPEAIATEAEGAGSASSQTIMYSSPSGAAARALLAAVFASSPS